MLYSDTADWKYAMSCLYRKNGICFSVRKARIVASFNFHPGTFCASCLDSWLICNVMGRLVRAIIAPSGVVRLMTRGCAAAFHILTRSSAGRRGKQVKVLKEEGADCWSIVERLMVVAVTDLLLCVDVLFAAGHIPRTCVSVSL